MAKVMRKDGSTLISRCGVAETVPERITGLLRHSSLPEDEGLWFPRNTSVHTFFMRFAIDVAFLDAKGKIIALYPSLRPWRHTWVHFFAAGGGTLEACAGLFARNGLKVGEELVVCPTS
ncbi:MAG TPA: DUF192 domain-containing protein [Bdellovibrionota bacterium]|jgi:hypothetical protein